MNESTNNSHSNLFETTIYNASCGVLGNVIYEFGKAMPA